MFASGLSTVREADQVVMHEGRHAELLARGGSYAALHAAQFGGEAAAD